jgi:sarcosine oxidase subunit gamma
VARLNAIVIRRDVGETLAYDLLTDIASAVYLWRALLDAMAEFDGAPVGLAAIRGLAGPQPSEG